MGHSRREAGSQIRPKHGCAQAAHCSGAAQWLDALADAEADALESEGACLWNDVGGVGELLRAQLARFACDDEARRSPPPPFKVRFLPDFQYLLEPASGVWLLGCGVLTSREA